jgi:non-reducing end alpha-L-arabinofuranosidase
MKPQAAVAFITIAFATLSSGCSSSSSNSGAGAGGSSNGGISGTGGSSGPGDTCNKVTACGGDLVGAWTVKSSCLKTTGTADISYLGLACLTAEITGSIDVTGTFTLGADGKFTDATVAKGSDTWALGAPCLELSGTRVTCTGVGSVFAATLSSYGYQDFKCVDAASGGGCSCQGTVNATGGLGLLYSDVSATGNYTSANNGFSLGNGLEYTYCVNGSELTVTPMPGKTDSTPYTGTIVLQKPGGGGGTGGAGAGGAASGGAGVGGVTGSQGGTGGTPVTGGAPSTGGRTGSSVVSTGGSSGVATGGNTGGPAGGTSARPTGGATAIGGTTGSSTARPTGGTTGVTVGGASATGGTTGSGTLSDGPCDIYKAASMPCAAAYSMVRSLSKSYTGPLFQVRAGSSSTNNTMSGGTTKDIMPGTDGFVDSATVDAACGTGYCTVSVMYDHSGNGNHLKRAQKGNTAGGATGALDDYESIATKGKVKAGGHTVYSLYMSKVEGYRSTAVGTGMPTGNKPQGTYLFADGTRKATACCWDFGNVTTNPATEWAFMDTICFGHTFWGLGNGAGPWFSIDFEGGVWAGGSKDGDPGWGALSGTHTVNTANPSMDTAQFALGFIRVNPTTYAIRAANVATATTLTTAYNGAIPTGISVNHKGGIVIGVGGDNSNNSWGTLYEGAIVSGFPTDAIEASVMSNVKAVGYAAAN